MASGDAGRRAPARAAKADVAVVVVTRDRARDLERTLRRLEELPERPPVIVVDHGSSDGTPAMVAARFPGVTLIEPGRDLGAAGRTAGVLAAGTPYVAFADDDSWWEPGSLRRAAELLDAHPDVGLLAARVLLSGGALEPTCAAMAASPLPRRPDLPGPRVLGFVACGAVVRRTAYLAAGGFPPGWGIGGEEQPFAAQLAERGWELVYVDALLAHHRPSATRDPRARLAIATRNDVWFAWLRRPATRALALTLRAAADPRRARGLLAAARAAPRIARARHHADPRLERDLRRLEHT